VKDLTVNATPLIKGGKPIEIRFPKIVISEIELTKDNELCFYIYSDKKCKANWLVLGKRHDIDVEVEKTSVNVKGKGPYKWI